MFAGRLKNITKRSIEGTVAVTLALFFFLLFLYFLNALFPSGTGLKAIIGRDRIPAPTDMDEKAMRKLMLSKGDQESDLAARKLAATIARIHNTLKSRRAEAVTWISAKE